MWYACQAEAAPRTVFMHGSMVHKLYYHQHYLKNLARSLKDSIIKNEKA